MAIQMKATVFDLEEAELCYAPQYGSAKDPVNMAGFVAANILRGDVAVSHWSEWKRRQEAGQTPLTLDVRPPTAVAAGAIPGTIRIPLGELRAGSTNCPATARFGSIAEWAKRRTTPSACWRSTGSRSATYRAG